VVVITLRIVAKYCLELESVAANKVDSLSPQQLACFVSTLKVLHTNKYNNKWFFIFNNINISFIFNLLDT